MKKIRRGNDFVFAWEIERNGLPEDLSSVLEKHLYLSVLGKRVELIEGVDYDITGNVVRIEITPAIANILGTYKAEFHYILPDIGFIDEDRKCAVDVDAFIIVNSTAKADDPSEFTVTSDMAIAFKGDKGDSSYQTWLEDGNTGTEEDYLDWIRQPATDIAETVNLQEQARIEAENTRKNNEEERIESEDIRFSNEQSRVDAEGLRASGEVARNTAEGIRVGNENTRIENEGIRLLAEEDRVEAENIRVENETLRISAELLREGAESDREDAEQLRQTNTSTAIQNANEATQNANNAAELANTKAGEANTAAQNADDAREAIQSDLGTKANHGYDSNPKTLKQVDDSLVQLAGEVSLLRDDATVKIENIVVNGDFANGETGWARYIPLSIPTFTQYADYINIVFSVKTTRSGLYQDANTVIGNKYYSRFVFRGILNEMLWVYSPNSTTTTTATGNWQTVSVLGTADAGTVRIGFRFIDQTGLASQSIDVKSFMTFNLSTIFGAGNEPTKEEMNLLISILGIEYFEGEITIPAQKIMQWELKMIRQNRSAIIALGGTII